MTEEEKPKQVRRQDLMIKGVASWKLIEAVLKHIWEFKALLESEGIDELTLDNGYVINYYDLLNGIDKLPEKQQQVIRLMCFQGLKEVECAKELGYESWSSPVGALKRAGLRTLADKYWNIEDPADKEDI